MAIFKRKAIPVILSCCLIVASILTGSLSVLAVPSDSSANSNKAAKSDSAITNTSSDSYFYYYNSVKDKERPTKSISVDVLSLKDIENKSVDGVIGALLGNKSNTLTWNFFVEQAGVYNIFLNYCVISGTDNDVVVNIALDGKIPYEDAKSFTLKRIWRDKLSKEGVFEKDITGSDIRPRQEAVECWTNATFNDVRGMYNEPYLFYLSEGNHTITISNEQAQVLISEITFKNEEKLPSYIEYRENVGKNEKATAIIRKEAEFSYQKNNRILYPTYDHADAATLPNDAYNIKLNTIGQSNWGTPGDYIDWKLDEIKQAGWYNIYFRVKQSYNSNSYSYRCLKINGEIPFIEAQNIDFYYDTKWYTETIEGKSGKSLSVYLEPGDILTLECISDETSEITRNINQSVLDLNAIYRQIIVITGPTPDVYRDYSLQAQLPNMISDFKTVYNSLIATKRKIVKLTGSDGPTVSTINEMLEILNNIIENPFTVPEYLTSLKDGIQNLGSLLQTVGKQPLELDCFYFVPEGKSLPRTEATFFKKMAFDISKFLSSFVNDYNTFSDEEGSSDKFITAWVSTGRDQMQIISNMITDTFVPKYKTNVKLSLVDTGGTLIQATLAGKGPDVALLLPSGTPINLAMRDALVDLSDEKFNLESLNDRFYPETWTPYKYNGGIYAIPESQVFDMLFYRKDIFAELGITPPKTWTEFYQVVRVIQNANLEVGMLEIDAANPGISAGIGTFARFLLQKGGQFYNEDFTKTRFDETIAYEAFEEWVNLYKKFDFSRQFDFYNLFRSGEMPMGISGYSTYNQLMTAAPEIRGLWAFTTVPGMVKEDGTVNIAQSSSGTGCMMMNSAVEKGIEKEAFEFMAWWTGDEAQARYANDLEAVMGVAARYTPANIKAFEQINWTRNEKAILKSQWEQVVNIPEIPGNYVVPRALTNAMRNAYSKTGPTHRQLDIYNKTINTEIEWKRKEFHLD